MPGLAKACNPNLSVPNGAVYLYSQSWTVSIVVAGVVYWVCHKLSPVEITSDRDDERIEGFEKDSEAGLDAETRSSSEKAEVRKAFDV